MVSNSIILCKFNGMTIHQNNMLYNVYCNSTIVGFEKHKIIII